MKIRKKNKDVLKKILKMFLITRTILVILLILSEIFLSNTNISSYKHVFDLFDNEHYLNIANNGYTHNFEYAFFPLTPLLIRYLGNIGFIILNQVCVFFSGYLLYLISDNFYRRKDSYYTALVYFVSPISIFTCMFYSEGLFLFLTILAFYLYKSKRNYLALGITLGLSVLTRSLGSMLFFSVFVFMFINFIKRKESLKNILITYIPATIISCLYPIFLYIRTGDLLYFTTVQYIYWRRTNTNIFAILFDSGIAIFSQPFFFYVVDYFIVFGLIFYIFKFIFNYRKEKKYYEIFLYMIFSLIAICSTIRNGNDPLVSFYRYIFGCFPIYFMIKKERLNFYLLLMLSFFIIYFIITGFYFY